MNEESQENPPTVHILHAGLSLCGFTDAALEDWPPGNLCVSLEAAQDAYQADVTCSVCKAIILHCATSVQAERAGRLPPGAAMAHLTAAVNARLGRPRPGPTAARGPDAQTAEPAKADAPEAIPQGEKDSTVRAPLAPLQREVLLAAVGMLGQASCVLDALRRHVRQLLPPSAQLDADVWRSIAVATISISQDVFDRGVRLHGLLQAFTTVGGSLSLEFARLADDIGRVRAASSRAMAELSSPDTPDGRDLLSPVVSVAEPTGPAVAVPAEDPLRACGDCYPHPEHINGECSHCSCNPRVVIEPAWLWQRWLLERLECWYAANRQRIDRRWATPVFLRGLSSAATAHIQEHLWRGDSLPPGPPPTNWRIETRYDARARRHVLDLVWVVPTVRCTDEAAQ